MCPRFFLNAMIAAYLLDRKEDLCLLMY
jgi:hypothetical protein